MAHCAKVRCIGFAEGSAAGVDADGTETDYFETTGCCE